MERPPPPPPPPPGTPGTPPETPGTPPGTPGTPPGTPGSRLGLGRVLREALQRAGEALGEDGGLRELLRRRRDSLEGPWKWLLFHRPVPPLIQDGPQCGLVALAMAGALLGPPSPKLSLGALLETARARGYTRHGEMFSASQLAALAQELLPCRAELLQGGLGGPNRARLLRHLLRGRPLLVPYDGDSNHAPCSRRGHRAHWALLIGLLVAVPPQQPLGPRFQRDPEVPNVFHARGFGSGGFQIGSGGSQFGEGAQDEGGAWVGFLGSLLEEGSQFGEGSQCQEGLRDWGWGSPFGEGSQVEGGSQFESGGSQFGEGSQPQEALPDLGRGTQIGSGGSKIESGGSQIGSGGSHFQSDCPQFDSGGSQIESGVPAGLAALELGLGSPFGSGGSKFKEGSQAEGGSQIESGGSQIGSGGSQIECGGSQIGSGGSQIESGGSQIGSGGSQIESGGSQIGSGGSQIECGGSQFESGVPAGPAAPELGLGSPFGSGGSQFKEGSQAESGSQLGEGSPHFGSGGSQIDSGGSQIGSGVPNRSAAPELGLGSPFGAGLLVLALQGKSPRPQLWALRELAASNGQVRELSPRRMRGGFVLPPGGLAEELQGRAVLLHPLPK